MATSAATGRTAIRVVTTAAIRRAATCAATRGRLLLASIAVCGLASLALDGPLPALAAGRFEAGDNAPEVQSERPRVRAGSGTLLGPTGPEVVLGIEVPYSELFFRPEGERFAASFDFVLVLYRGKEQVGGDVWPEKREVLSATDTRSGSLTARRTAVIAAPPGRYKAEAILREEPAGRSTRVRWDVEVPDYDKAPLALSSLWVADCPDTSADPVRIPPDSWHMSRRVGEPAGPLCVSAELYRSPGDTAEVRLLWRLVGEREEEADRGEIALKQAETGPAVLTSGRSAVPFRFRPRFDALWLGSYRLEVTARSGGNEARRSFLFEVDDAAASFENDPRQALELIALIATSEEVKEIRETPPGQRKEAWNRFWKRHDPTPDTVANEFKDRFFARVRKANEEFAAMGPGWRTDRGRIYIQNGPPDLVQDYPAAVNNPARVVWTYVRLGRTFVFVDRDGFGIYELAASS